jgi:hypothetical protein
MLLALDAAVLLVLGAWLIIAPGATAQAFRFTDLPVSAHYLLGLWGCALATLSIGYLAAAQDPLRHVVWVQVGIARGALEFVLGIVYVALGVVTLPMALFGIIVAGFIAVAYAVLYPRPQPTPPLPELGEGAGG